MKLNKQDENKIFFPPHLNLRLLLSQSMTLGKVYHFKAGNLFSILTCHKHGGAGVIFIPGRCGILLCNIWPEKGRLLLWGFPVGRSMLDIFMGLVTGSVVMEGLQGGLGPTAQQSLAGASALSSPGDYLPCLSSSSIPESKASLVL